MYTFIRVTNNCEHSYFVGNEKVVEMLIEAGVSVNQPNYQGFTALHLAGFNSNCQQIMKKNDETYDEKNGSFPLRCVYFQGERKLDFRDIGKIDIKILNIF